VGNRLLAGLGKPSLVQGGQAFAGLSDARPATEPVLTKVMDFVGGMPAYLNRVTIKSAAACPLLQLSPAA